MKEVTLATDNFTKKDKMNLISAVTMDDFRKDNPDTPITVIKAALIDSVEEDTGEVKKVSCIIGDDGKSYISISSTVREQVADMIDYINECIKDGGYNDEDYATATIVSRKSKGGRDFLVLEIG